jgi:hypothetical protein
MLHLRNYTGPDLRIGVARSIVEHSEFNNGQVSGNILIQQIVEYLLVISIFKEGCIRLFHPIRKILLVD